MTDTHPDKDLTTRHPDAKSGNPIRRALGALSRGAKAAYRPFTRVPVPVYIALAVVFVAVSLTALVLFYAPTLREWTLAVMPGPGAEAAQTSRGTTSARDRERLQRAVTNLKKQYEYFTPRRAYLIVDTSNNRFTLMSGDKVIREGICSTGSYVLLKAGDKREWVFKTPRGRFYVQRKEESPVWHKPDWAFIEEGLPVPPEGSPERNETGVLGDYALHLGHGYLIHGTLYKRLLGMPVTHGCVRLDDEDLSAVWKNLSTGSAVFIY